MLPAVLPFSFTMKTERRVWTRAAGWGDDAPSALTDADWVIYFGASEALDAARHAELKARYPSALLLGCTTGGEITADDVHDDSVTAMAVKLSGTRIRGAERMIDPTKGSFAAGAALGADLAEADLKAVFVLSDGTRVNGTELVRGIRSAVHDGVVVTGGLAGDGPRFGTTRAGLGHAPATGMVCAVGLSGDSLVIGHGRGGGWVPFGPERLVTRSKGNVLLELDHQPALELYKRYLGEEAQQLPASALLYPLVIRRREHPDEALVRTIVGIDEATNAMVFAGDVPEGAVAQLMRASIEQLVDGAAAAATAAKVDGVGGFAVLVSCIGRKLLLGQRTADEVDAVTHILGKGLPSLGFYSYGEISPCASGFSDLHNQTMTITTFAER